MEKKTKILKLGLLKKKRKKYLRGNIYIIK